MSKTIDFYGPKVLKTVQADAGIVKYAIALPTYRLDLTLRTNALPKPKNSATGYIPIVRNSLLLVKTIFATPDVPKHERRFAFTLDAKEGDDVEAVALEFGAVANLLLDEAFAAELATGIFEI